MGPDAIPPLFAILQNTRDHRKVGAAAKAVGRIGKPAVKPTIQALRDGERYLPSHAVRVAGAIGEPAVPSLIDLLSDDDHRVRQRAREALAKVGRPAIEPLVKVLRRQESLRSEVLRVLAEMEGRARPAADAVAELFLETDDENVRHRAIVAMGEIGQAAASKPVLREMIAVLRGDQDRVKDDTARALERMGSAARPVVDGMTDVLPSLKGRAKADLIRAIGNQKQAAADAVDELTAALKTKGDRRVRENAAWALGEIGAAARPALDDLQAAAKDDENRGVRERAERSVRRIREALSSKEN
jgi:HEAT repeat protein